MNLHPIIVHFPIALLIVGFAFTSAFLVFKNVKCSVCGGDTLKNTGYLLLLVGSVSSIVAVGSGYIFTNAMEGVMGEMRNTHAISAIITTVLSVITTVIYTLCLKKEAQGKPKVLYIVMYLFYLVTAGMVGFTGHLGGEMVYMFK